MKRSMMIVVVICFLLTACTMRSTPTPTPEPTATPRPTTLAPTSTLTPTPTRSPTRTLVPTPTVTIYVVQAGDVLGAIAKNFGTTVEAIAKANGISDLDLIRIGQELVIPIGGASAVPISPTATP